MIKNTMIATFLWLVILGPYDLWAQENSTIALPVLWQEVQQNYPGLQAEELHLHASELDKEQIKTKALPRLKVQGQNTYSSLEPATGGFFAQPGIFTVNSAQINPGESSTVFNAYASTTLEWEVYSFGKIRKQNQSAQALYDKVNSQSQGYTLEVKKLLSSRYISVLYHKAQENWSLSNMQRLDDIQKITASLSKAGLKPVADSLLASSSYISAKGDHTKMQGLYQGAVIKVLELTQNNTLSIEPNLEAFFNPVVAQITSWQSIQDTHPFLQAIDKQTQYYNLKGDMYKRSYLPSVNFLAGYAFRSSGVTRENTVSTAWSHGFENSISNFALGIGITWDITGIYSNKLKSKSFSNMAKSSDLRFKEHQNAMSSDLEALEINLQSHYGQISDSKASVDQALQAYNMYMARYKNGLIPLGELLQIEFVLQQSQNNLILALKQYWDLLAYQGELTNDFSFLFSNL